MKTDMRVYMANRRAERRAKLIELAGGKCINCDSIENLQFDHIDPETKLFRLSGAGLDKSWKYILQEFEKCQLLCEPCHIEKTKVIDSFGHGEGLLGKRNCYCDLCKPLKYAHSNEYRRARRKANR